LVAKFAGRTLAQIGAKKAPKAQSHGIHLGCQKFGIGKGIHLGDFIPLPWLKFSAISPGLAMPKSLTEYLTPKHKVLEMFKQSRDNLRLKYRELMEQRRVAENPAP
jgi:hypothetical protein